MYRDASLETIHSVISFQRIFIYVYAKAWILRGHLVVVLLLLLCFFLFGKIL